MKKHRPFRNEEGYTLVELLVVFALMAVLVTISMTAFRAYARAQGHRGAHREVVAILRNTQVRAVTEVATYECRFTDSAGSPTGTPLTQMRIFKSGVATPTRIYELSAQVRFISPAFTDSAGNTGSSCFFYGRGSASPGNVLVRRIDTSPPRDLSVTIQGLTGRVSS